MSNPIFSEQGDWNGHSALAIESGKEINHVCVEDLRRLMFLLMWFNTDASKISNYKIGREFYGADAADDKMAYAVENRPTSPTNWRNYPLWVKCSRVADTFAKNGIGYAFGGGTVWYENNYQHTCQFVTRYNKIQLKVLTGNSFLGAINDITEDGESAYYDLNRFRVGTPVKITSTNNSVTGRVAARVYDSGFYLDITVNNPDQPLVADAGYGTVSCWFGGDYYMTNSDFTWNQSHFQENNRTWNIDGNDTRPPDGGFLSENSNGFWCRTVNPYRYHDWDLNSNRRVAVAYVDNDTLEHDSADYKSSDYFPIHLDPWEQTNPTYYLTGARGKFDYNPQEIVADKITQAAKLGALWIAEGKAFRLYGNWTTITCTGDNQYLGYNYYQSGVPWFLHQWTEPYADVETEFYPCLKYSSSTYSSYQQMAEYFVSAYPYLTYIADSGGADYMTQYRLNWFRNNPNRDGKWRAFSDDTDSTKSNFVDSNSDFLDNNGSTFELALDKIDSYHWYFDTSKPYIPRNIQAQRALIVAKNEEGNGGLGLNPGDPGYVNPDTEYPLPVGTWRKTWKYSLGRKSQFMTHTDPGRMSAITETTPTDSGLRIYPNDEGKIALLAGDPEDSQGFIWPGRYAGGKPKASCFRNAYRTIVSRNNSTLTLDSAVDLRQGAMVQFYSSDGDIDDYVTELRVVSCDGIYMTLESTPPDSGIVQWDTHVINNHDAIQMVDTTNKYEMNPLLLHEIRDVLRSVEYRKLSVSIEIAGFIGSTSDPWTGMNVGDPYTTRDSALAAAEHYLAVDIPWPPKNEDGDYLIDTDCATGFEKWQWGPFSTEKLGSSKKAMYISWYPTYKWAGLASITSFAFKISDGESIVPDSSTVILPISYAYSLTYPHDSNWTLPGVIDGIEGISFTVKGKTYSLPSPTLKAESSGGGWSYVCVLNDTPEGQDLTRYGWIESSIDEQWNKLNFSTSISTGTIDLSKTESQQTKFGVRGARVGVNLITNIGVELDPNIYPEIIWKRDYTYATFYYDTYEENHAPWPNPAQFLIDPELTGVEPENQEYILVDAYEDTVPRYHLLVDGLKNRAFSKVRLSDCTDPTWDGDYTVSSIGDDFPAVSEFSIQVSEANTNFNTTPTTGNRGTLTPLYSINGCGYDGERYYFIAEFPGPYGISEAKAVIISDSTNWDGEYTVYSVESFIGVDGSDNPIPGARRWKITVNETCTNTFVPDTLAEFETSMGYIKCGSFWEITAVAKLCEDREGDDPVTYRLVSSGIGPDLTTDWQEDREFHIYLGDTDYVQSLFNVYGLENLAFQVQAKDSESLETRIDVYGNPPVTITYGSGWVT